MKTNPDKKIPPNVVKRIRILAYALAEHSENKLFEVSHMQEVEKNCLMLAKRRGLDNNKANLIALLHDLGRVKNGVYGKGHAAESAVIAGEILYDHGVDNKAIKTICRAIINHNRKSTIHDKYSELIKDADSISAFDGRDINGQRTFEYIRFKYADSVKFEVIKNPEADIVGSIKSSMANILKNLTDLKNSESPYGLIHEIRTNIRKTRSVLWYMKNNPKAGKSGVVDSLDSGLKEISEDYDRLRELQVFKKDIMGMDGCRELYIYLDKQRKNELKRILNKKLRNQIKLADELQKNLERLKNPAEGLIPVGSEYLKKLKKAMEAVNDDDVESMHRLRKECKKFIYLEEAGILSFSQQDIKDLLLSINKKLGIINDAAENTKLLIKIEKQGVKCFPVIQIDFTKKIVIDKARTAMKESKPDVLELRIRT